MGSVNYRVSNIVINLAKLKDSIMTEATQKFEKLLAEVTNDLADAKYQSELYRNLHNLVPEYSREMNQSVAFWQITLDALQESSILALSRVYDQDNRGIHLETLIKFIQDNLSIFETSKFRERLKDNSYVERLSQRNRIPTPEQLGKDLKIVSKKDPLVNKLIQLRGNIIAHKNKDQALGTKKSIAPLTWAEFDELIARGLKIRNYYSDLYNASTLAADALIGKEDYQTVLKYLRIAMITLDFINVKTSSIKDNNYKNVLTDFLKEVNQEIYRNL